MFDGLKKWLYTLQGKFILVATLCIIIFSTVGSFIILSREEGLYRQDIINQGEIIAKISRVILTNVMIYNELGMMDKHDLIDYLDYFIIDIMQQDKRVKYIDVVDNKGRIIVFNNAFKHNFQWEDSSAPDSLNRLKTVITQDKYGNEPIIKMLIPLNISTKLWGGLRIVLSTKDVENVLLSLKREVFLITFLFSIISLVIISIGAKVISKPVIKLSRMMDGIKTHGDLKQQSFELKERQDEVGKLQKSFFWMLQRLKDADREHKKTIEVLAQTEKMVAIGRLASGVAHEINNPLSGIILCFKNLIKEEVNAETKEELTQVINDSFQKIKNIVEQLLDFSRLSVTEKKPVNLNSFLTRLLVLVTYPASKKGIKIINKFTDNIPEIMIDENKMSQVFMNIMINALQAMEKGGTLAIETYVNSGFCVISIEDTGVGIPPDIIQNIFDPFFTTKEVGEGTGLGLSVSRGIVEQHGGMIEVDSHCGLGTTFKVKLPVE